jgi:hypothetical protein
VSAAAHRFINAAELSRELRVSPYMLAKLQVRGQVPPPDGFLRGAEIWNADRVPSIRSALEAHQEVAKP